jgi:hypothetical protein
MSKSRICLEFAAGVAIGLLVGLIAGLSISPVVGMILGALSTSLLILLGFKESKDATASIAHAIRVLGFGLSCSIALIAGILLRTHAVLSPSLSEQKSRLAVLSTFTPTEIQQILLLTNYGLQPPSTDSSTSPQSESPNKKPGQDEKSPLKDKEKVLNVTSPQRQTATLASAGLLRSGSAEFCQSVRWDNSSSPSAYVAELRRWDPRLAHFIDSLPVDMQDQASKALSKSLCP